MKFSKIALTTLTGLMLMIIALFTFQTSGSAEPVKGAVDLFTEFNPGQSVAAVPLLTMIDKKLVKDFRESHNWLSVIPKKNQYVNNNVINLIDIGGDPDVLINNTVYPIPIQPIDDDGLVLSLSKFSTKATPVTADEMYAAAYDKESSLRERHKEVVLQKMAKYGLYNLAPASHSAKTPVLECTGATVGGAGTRKRLTSNDLIKGNTALKGVVPEGARWRHLVLCPEHLEDLLLEDRNLQNRLHNHTTGELAKNYYGFTLWLDSSTSRYDDNGDKVGFEAAPQATDRVSSQIFTPWRSWQAVGDIDAYYSPKKQDTQYHRSLYNIEVYQRTGQLKAEGFGALVSQNG